MNIKRALTRKMGPLPAWAWLGIFAIAVYYYRNKMSGTASTQSGTGTGSVSPFGLQALQPGTSYYDSQVPGQFFTTPGGGSGGGTSGGGASGHHGGNQRHHHNRHHKPKKIHNKKPKGFEIPGRRIKGGTSHHTHHPRQHPATHHPSRDREKTEIRQPVKSRPTEHHAPTHKVTRSGHQRHR